VGQVTGFLLTWTGQRSGAVYISGDTVLYDELDQVRGRGPIGTAFLHMGGAAFRDGGMRFTMTARDAATLSKKLGARRVFPVHTDGWTHFRDDASRIGEAFSTFGFSAPLWLWSRGETVSWDG
jgi:L-ascorbate metabolism protein UlaG (beta-lactamase superfamily)